MIKIIFFIFLIYAVLGVNRLQSQINFTKDLINKIDKSDKNELGIIYKNEIIQANLELKKYKSEIKKILSTKDSTLILAIGFPEVIRYNAFSDLFETTSNEQLYSKLGKSVSDFSTGLFQMKPSFIEDLEKYIKKNKVLKVYNTILISESNIKKERLARIKKLNNIQWQLLYLKVFWAVCEHKFINIKFKDNNKKLQFYANAYNAGFMKSTKDIIVLGNKKQFPFGKNIPNKNFAYSEFSIYYYNQNQNY